MQTTKLNYDTAYFDLKETYDYYRRHRSAWSKSQQDQAHNLYIIKARAVGELWGQLNGWTRCNRFALDQLGKVNGDSNLFAPVWCQPEDKLLSDADAYYRHLSPEPDSQSVPAAIIGQPTRFTKYQTRATEIARQFGLTLHRPPIATASFYKPGTTLLLVLTAPGVEVKWLPGQMQPTKPNNKEEVIGNDSATIV